MSTEENMANQRRVFEEGFNQKKLEVIDEFFAPSYSFKSPLGMDIKGAEGFKEILAVTQSALPDLQVTIEDMFAANDKVATRFTMTGTFTNEMMGIFPTGKSLSISGIVITRWEDGKEVEAWESFDTLGYYQQLGLTPPN
ncbi:MAG: ester cyclase [Dehalococcoidales bacterium]|nr:ester cyclase [Dehalococcoidales bacterium]